MLTRRNIVASSLAGLGWPALLLPGA
ncbi:MAG: hypothetical protein JWQ72_32, partial [Polaromonas sp.]|nr:hypothetical protein [Polaromonas sp.]